MTKLTVHMILEILGRPKENVEEGLRLLTEKLSKEKGVKILEESRHSPVEVKDSKDLFTSFAELTLELDSLNEYFGILFAYMPSNIEIIEPQKLSLTNVLISETGNRILSRLHEYDAIAKKMISERNFLAQKLKEKAPELFNKKDKLEEKDIKKEKKSKKN